MDSSYLNRAADKCGFVRQRYIDSKIPTTRDNICIIPFFGDFRATAILSSLLIKRYKNKYRNKYIIICSWEECSGLFPYADEYWILKDKSNYKLLSTGADDFSNVSNVEPSIRRNLNEFFDNVVTYENYFKEFYDNGLTNSYWKTYENLEVWLPGLPSATILSGNINNFNKKIVLYPERKIRSWQAGKVQKITINSNFWIALVERLIKDGFKPIIYQNNFTYDLSKEFSNRCEYIVSNDILFVLRSIREVGCAIDIFSGFSTIAKLARCPYVCLTERRVYLESKDMELDDMICSNLPKQYIFGFSGQALTGSNTDWDINLFNIILKKVDVISEIRQDLPSTVELEEEVSYEKIRKRNSRRMGVRYISMGKRTGK